VRVAERIGGEIVGCDALQVYRGLDAATAKPTAEQRGRVPHHLVDVVDPGTPFSLGAYVKLAEEAIAGIDARGGTPLVVGGTGMYLRGLLRGVVAAPAGDPALRERLRRLASRFGSPRLHRWLARLDPPSAKRLPPADAQRVTRALEGVLAGRPWSRALEEGGTWGAVTERYASLKIALDLPRDVHAARLEARVAGFFAAGLVREVRGLLASGLSPGAGALKAIGYREVAQALLAGRPPEATREEIARATRRYAKRQRTWFRAEPAVTWLDAGAGAEAVAARVAALWRERAR
jgi:tRNA dimethylallyltransferase